MYLKIKNCCLKICVEIPVGEKCIKIRVILFKNWKLLFKNISQTPLKSLGVEYPNNIDIRIITFVEEKDSPKQTIEKTVTITLFSR